MRYLAAITMLVLALAMVQPVAAQSFKPDLEAGYGAWKQKDYATSRPTIFGTLRLAMP